MKRVKIQRGRASGKWGKKTTKIEHSSLYPGDNKDYSKLILAIIIAILATVILCAL